MVDGSILEAADAKSRVAERGNSRRSPAIQKRRSRILFHAFVRSSSSVQPVNSSRAHFKTVCLRSGRSCVVDEALSPALPKLARGTGSLVHYTRGFEMPSKFYYGNKARSDQRSLVPGDRSWLRFVAKK